MIGPVITIRGSYEEAMVSSRDALARGGDLLDPSGLEILLDLGCEVGSDARDVLQAVLACEHLDVFAQRPEVLGGAAVGRTRKGLSPLSSRTSAMSSNCRATSKFFMSMARARSSRGTADRPAELGP